MVSRLPRLEALDMSPVTDAERHAAARMYGALTLKIVCVMCRCAALTHAAGPGWQEVARAAGCVSRQDGKSAKFDRNGARMSGAAWDAREPEIYPAIGT